MQYWLVITSPENFRFDREKLGFRLQGFSIKHKNRVQQMAIGDRVLYYIMTLHKFGATATISGDYFEDSAKVWLEDDEMWQARRPSKPDTVLNDDELVDIKRLLADLSFVKDKENWGVYLRGGCRTIPEQDFKLIESEMKKVVAERTAEIMPLRPPARESETSYEKQVMELPLESNSLHDRLAEMLETVGAWMDYNTQTRHKIAPDHGYELDVAWLLGKNPEVAIEIQIGGNITEAKDRLAQARMFNYRKVIMVLKSSDLDRLNKLMRYETDLRSWMETWSIGAVYEMYMAGETFFKYYHLLREATFKKKEELDLVR